MINIIIPMSGQSLYETNNGFAYPKVITEIENKTLLEYSQDVFRTLKDEYKVIFVAPEVQLNKLGLRSIIKTISDKDVEIVSLHGATKGAVCSCLMAIDKLNLDEELIISSADHCIDVNLQDYIESFRKMDCDAGILTFQSVHPKWSFVLLNKDNEVYEAAEKNPISKNAIAGLYYFRKTSSFIDAAKSLIRKNSSIEGSYYISTCLNEMVLSGKIIKAQQIDKSLYHNFYDAHTVNSFHPSLNENPTLSLTKNYVEIFNSGNIESIIEMFEPDAVLEEPVEVYQGIANIKNRISEIFENNPVNFISTGITAKLNKSILEFNLIIGGNTFKGLDVIEWSEKNKISKITSYLKLIRN